MVMRKLPCRQLRGLRVRAPLTRVTRLLTSSSAAHRPAYERKLENMKRLALVTGILALAAPVALAQTSTWISDPAHSEVDFSIKHLSVSNVHGRFGHVSATIALNDTDITKSTVNATIDVTGVDTGE